MPEEWSGNQKPWKTLITARYKSQQCQLRYLHKASPRGILCCCFRWGSAEPSAVLPECRAARGPGVCEASERPRGGDSVPSGAATPRPGLHAPRAAPALLPAAVGARWLRARLHSPEHRSRPHTPPPFPPPPRRRAAAAAAARAQDPPPPRAGGGRAGGRGRARRAARERCGRQVPQAEGGQGRQGLWEGAEGPSGAGSPEGLRPKSAGSPPEPPGGSVGDTHTTTSKAGGRAALGLLQPSPAQPVPSRPVPRAAGQL